MIVVCLSIQLVAAGTKTMSNNNNYDKISTNQDIIKIEPGLEVLYRYAPKRNKNKNASDPAEKYYVCSIGEVQSRRSVHIIFKLDQK